EGLASEPSSSADAIGPTSSDAVPISQAPAAAAAGCPASSGNDPGREERFVIFCTCPSRPSPRRKKIDWIVDSLQAEPNAVSAAVWPLRPIRTTPSPASIRVEAG